MCGISGIYHLNKQVVDFSLMQKINNTLIHRGPDSGDIAIFNNVGLGHRRLSIIDVSISANQPMLSEDGRYCIVYNGEVYNFLELKTELESLKIYFKTKSDTEVVLKAFQVWGDKCFAKFNGMFALAIYDTLEKKLIIARDQFGIKPLYYYHNEDIFIFGSEIKTILAHPNICLDLNKQALAEYAWYGNPLGNNTIYKNIHELNPGHYLNINSEEIVEKTFFKISDTIESKINEKDAIEKIKILLEKSVKRHLISDVPVGVFLSGGIDSSAITAFASRHYQGKLNTYSVGFDFEKGPNELKKAASVAKLYETEHHEIHISGNNIISTIEDLVRSHDEPFGDAANIPLYLLTKELRGQIKVVLQGDGGDEFFGGYSRYKTLQSANRWKYLFKLSNLLKYLGTNNTKALRLKRFLEAISQNQPFLKQALLLTVETIDSNPLRIFNTKIQNRLFKVNPFEEYEKIYETFDKNIDELQALFYTDTQIILKDTFFEKVDKSTMANSIEVRVPFVDKNLTEFMLTLPASLKVKNGVQKYLLKKSLEGIVPNEILYGKKTGFSVPYDFWLCNSLSKYFTDQISTQNASKFLNLKELKAMYELHRLGKGNFGFLLWKALNFAVWINLNEEKDLKLN